MLATLQRVSMLDESYNKDFRYSCMTRSNTSGSLFPSCHIVLARLFNAKAFSGCTFTLWSQSDLEVPHTLEYDVLSNELIMRTATRTQMNARFVFENVSNSFDRRVLIKGASTTVHGMCTYLSAAMPVKSMCHYL